MGYHIIIPDGSGYIRYYVENPRELADIDDINEKTIIYEGAESNIPHLLSKFAKSKDYAKDIFRLGIKAENLFKEQAQEHKFIVLDIDQSQEGFTQYKNSLDDDVKRADFSISNANVEVDVKCKTIYENNEIRFFLLNEHDVTKHLNMMEYTLKPVIIAVYQRLDNEPDPEALHMIEVAKIKKLKEAGEIRSTKDSCYKIDLSLTMPGFELLEGFRIKRPR